MEINAPTAESGTPFPYPYRHLALVYIAPDESFNFAGIEAPIEDFESIINEELSWMKRPVKILLVADKDVPMQTIHRFIHVAKAIDASEIIFAVDQDHSELIAAHATR